MSVPIPTPISRLIHLDNLELCLRRAGLHAPNCTPSDGLAYRTIHNQSIQAERNVRPLTCGPQGVIHDYVPFYFGYLSPMLLQLKTGRVPGYSKGQEPLIYLCSTAQAIDARGLGYVFSDGHGIAAYTSWYDNLRQLNCVDWSMVYQRYWSDTVEDMDRQRRKQAEFLVYQFCPWDIITEIAVLNTAAQSRVASVFRRFDTSMARPVVVRSDWYYY
jgi:hypothetical protein